MADTNTTRLNLTKPEVGASSDTWGTKWNTNADTLDGLFDAGPALKVANGGTGGTTQSTARAGLGLGTAATQNTGTSGANVPLLNGANTWSSSQTFGTGSGIAQIFVNGGAGSERNLVYQTNGSTRWIAQTSGTAEAGSNAGSNYLVSRFNDAGVFVDIPLQITRSTGLTTIKELALTTDLAVAHGGTGASDAATARTNLGLGTAAAQNTGTSGANVPLLNGTNTWSSAQTFSATNTTFGSGSTAVNLLLNGSAGQVRGHIYRTAGADRWIVGAGANAETGSNAGSPYFINRYTDAGVYIDTPLSIDRASGVTTLKELNLTTALAVTQGGTGTTTSTGTGSVVRAASPALSGTPTAPTAAAYTNSTQIATTANVRETASTVPINYQLTTSYTLTASDQGKLLLLENSSPITLTVPADSSVNFPIGTRIDVVQWFGAGQITFSAPGGTSIVSAGSKVKTASTYSGATLIKHAANGWLLIGDLA